MSAETNREVGRRLRRERLRLNWSQEELAQAIETTAVSISRWERGITLPQPYYREQLCKVFQIEALPLFEAGEEEQLRQKPARPEIWNLPYSRNLYFTGRERLLQGLRAAITSSPTTPMVALSGLGGIGKTQLALEYAYRYCHDYQAILWFQAESEHTLATSALEVVALLDLAPADFQNTGQAQAAIKRWLQTHVSWLVVFDSVERETMEQSLAFIPIGTAGHVLYTTQSLITGVAMQNLAVSALDEDEGSLFLLRRARLLNEKAPLEQAPPSMRDQAGALVRSLEGLPLVLDQAGAYIEETGCGLENYAQLYQQQRKQLLELRGGISSGHPHSFSATIALSYEKASKNNPLAAAFLCFCAMLHPAHIPEKLLLEGDLQTSMDGSEQVLELHAFNRAIATLRGCALIQRNAEMKTLTFHRLVQEVLRDRMDEATSRRWAEQAVRAVGRAFPDAAELTNWPQCQQYLEHALICVEWITRWRMIFPEAARLLYLLGAYLMEQSQYDRAETLIRQARDMYEQLAGGEDEHVASCVNGLAELTRIQGRYAEAETLHLHAIELREKLLGPEHLDLATSLNTLAGVYDALGRYEEAGQLFQRALAIRERNLGPQHPQVTISLNNIASIHYVNGEYEQAEQLFLRVIDIREQTLGKEHPHLAVGLNNLAKVLVKQKKYTEAYGLYQRAVDIFQKAFGPDHPSVATCISNLAQLGDLLENYEEAESLHRQALALRKKVFGEEHAEVAASLRALAHHYALRHCYEQTGQLYQQSLDIYNRVFGPQHPEAVAIRQELADALETCRQNNESKKMGKNAHASPN